jgi:hypothetical protein
VAKLAKYFLKMYLPLSIFEEIEGFLLFFKIIDRNLPRKQTLDKIFG